MRLKGKAGRSPPNIAIKKKISSLEDVLKPRAAEILKDLKPDIRLINVFKMHHETWALKAGTDPHRQPLVSDVSKSLPQL